MNSTNFLIRREIISFMMSFNGFVERFAVASYIVAWQLYPRNDLAWVRGRCPAIGGTEGFHIQRTNATAPRS
jgi:hypothetical protein